MRSLWVSNIAFARPGTRVIAVTGLVAQFVIGKDEHQDIITHFCLCCHIRAYCASLDVLSKYIDWNNHERLSVTEETYNNNSSETRSPILILL